MSATSEHMRFINPPEMATPPGFTHVVAVTGGRLAFISGQVAQNRDGDLVGVGDFRAQAEQVFANLAAALAAVNATFDHVVKFTLYLTDMANLPTLREVRNGYVNTAQPPASTAVAISQLAHPDWLLEIEAVAVVPGA